MESKYRSLGDSTATFIFHLEPSKKSKLHQRLTQAFEEVRENYGTDPAHLYSPHCSLTSFFCVKLSGTESPPLEASEIYSDSEEFVETCCETESAHSRWNECTTAFTTKLSPNEHDSVSEANKIVRQGLIENLIGAITTECELNGSGFPSYHETATGIKLETPAFEIFAESRDPKTVASDLDRVLVKTPSGRAVVPLKCDWFTDASGSEGGLSRINLLCRNMELSLHAVGRVFPLRKTTPSPPLEVMPSVSSFGDISSVASRVSGFFSRASSAVSSSPVSSSPAFGVKSKRVDHLSLATHRSQDELDGVCEIFGEALLDSINGSLWDIVAYERIPLGTADGEFILKEVTRVANIGISTLPAMDVRNDFSIMQC